MLRRAFAAVHGHITATLPSDLAPIPRDLKMATVVMYCVLQELGSDVERVQLRHIDERVEVLHAKSLFARTARATNLENLTHFNLTQLYQSSSR